MTTRTVPSHRAPAHTSTTGTMTSRKIPARRADAGNAVAEFVLVAALLSLVFAAVLQIVLAIHVRNTVTDSALAGARHASLVGHTPDQGAEVARELITTAISPSYAEDITVSEDHEAGLVTVTIRTPVPVVGFLGPSGVWELRGRALMEDPS